MILDFLLGITTSFFSRGIILICFFVQVEGIGNDSYAFPQTGAYLQSRKVL